jgi:hypothetical protein
MTAAAAAGTLALTTLVGPPADKMVSVLPLTSNLRF